MGREESIIQKVCVHTCCDTCHPAPDNLANEDSLPDNENIALVSTMKSRDERVTTKDAAPNSNTTAAAALGGRPSTHSSERHVQESLVDSMGSGHPAVIQLAPQMVSSLRATVEPGAGMEPSGVDPNFDARACQPGQSNPESRTKSVVHASWDNSPDCQTPALKPSPDFCVVHLSLRVEPKWMLGLRVSIMGRSLLSLQMVLRNQRPILTPWNQLLLVLLFLGKRFFRTQMTW